VIKVTILVEHNWQDSTVPQRMQWTYDDGAGFVTGNSALLAQSIVQALNVAHDKASRGINPHLGRAE
jgi:hypothetical protein